ncbi:hypothetical protein ACIBSV_10095 [Embleya sp. NPDC050154]|uniref:hypothetical protein n=1 Tax=Embleya sp. NPDC050154 TaxID=3363988 RepID=UPI0037B5C039
MNRQAQEEHQRTMARAWAEFQSAQALRFRMDRIAYDASLQDPAVARNYYDYWKLDRLTGTGEIQEYLRQGLTEIRGSKGGAFVTIHPETDPLHARMTALSLLVMARQYGEVDLRSVTIDDTVPGNFPNARAVATQGESPAQLGLWFKSTLLRTDNRENFLRGLLQEERNAFGAHRRFGVASTAVHEFGHGIGWAAEARRRAGKLYRNVPNIVLNSVRPDEMRAIWGAVVHRYGNELRSIEASGADSGTISNRKADLHQRLFGSDTVLRNQQAAATVATKIGTYANIAGELDADTVAGAVLGGDSQKGLPQELFAELMWTLGRSADDRPRFLNDFLHGMQVTELDRSWRSGYVPQNNAYLLAAAAEPLRPIPPPNPWIRPSISPEPMAPIPKPQRVLPSPQSPESPATIPLVLPVPVAGTRTTAETTPGSADATIPDLRVPDPRSLWANGTLSTVARTFTPARSPRGAGSSTPSSTPAGEGADPTPRRREGQNSRETRQDPRGPAMG